MPNLLVIDTSSATCAVALSTSDTYSSRSSSVPRHAAQHILPMVSEVLLEADCPIAQLDGIAVMAGPGSFTGIRIGLGVAQGLSMANATPVLGLSSLAVAALAALTEASGPDIALVSEKARDDEVYFACYRRSQALGVELLGIEQVGLPGELILSDAAGRAADDWLLVGGGWQQREAIGAALQVTLPAQVSNPDCEIRQLATLAALRFAQGEAMAAELVTPNYVKESMQYSR